MAIPDYQTIMLPLIKSCSDKQLHNLREMVDKLAEQFQLTAEEKKQLLPSGRRLIFYDRVSWARTYLAKAKLLVLCYSNILTIGLPYVII